LNDPQVAPRLLKAIPISPQVVPPITLVAPTPLEANLVPLAQSMTPNTPSQTTKSSNSLPKKVLTTSPYHTSNFQHISTQSIKG
jgi:hypothetical protein